MRPERPGNTVPRIIYLVGELEKGNSYYPQDEKGLMNMTRSQEVCKEG
jgi:hypothetical protein